MCTKGVQEIPSIQNNPQEGFLFTHTNCQSSADKLLICKPTQVHKTTVYNLHFFITEITQRTALPFFQSQDSTKQAYKSQYYRIASAGVDFSKDSR